MSPADDGRADCWRFFIPAFLGAHKEYFHTYFLYLQDLNEAHGVVAELHSKFFGLPHMFAVVKLLGSRSLPWLVRALLDYLSQKVNCMGPSLSHSFDIICSILQGIKIRVPFHKHCGVFNFLLLFKCHSS